MRIKIAIILICWSVLFVSAYAIDDQSVKQVLNRNSLSVGFVSDFVQEIIPPEEAAVDDETVSGENAGWEVQGNGSINGTGYVNSNNSSWQENEHRSPYKGPVIPLPD